MIRKIISMLVCMALFVLPAFAQGSAIVAEIGDVQITRAELDAAYEVSYGDYAGDDEQLAFELRHELVMRMVEERAEEIMQERMGFDTPTQEEIDAITAQAQEEYEGYIEYYAVLFDDGSMTHEELRIMAQSYLASMDLSLEDYTQQAISALASEKLRAWALEGMVVTEEYLLSTYETMLEDEKALYDAFPDSFLSCAYYGIPYLYAPEGVREIRHIVIAFDDEQLTEYAFLSDAREQGADVDADMDALYSQLSNRVTEVLNQLDTGKSFYDVEMEYSDGWLVQDGSGSGVYYVCEGSQIWDETFVTEAMALEEVGQVSGPVRMYDGIHILYYAGDVPAGPVAFEQVREYVAECAQYQLETQTYSEAMDGWLEELDAQIYLEELQ